MCRQGGYYEQAAYLAKEHGETELVVDILVEDSKNYGGALEYIWHQDPEVVCIILQIVETYLTMLGIPVFAKVRPCPDRALSKGSDKGIRRLLHWSIPPETHFTGRGKCRNFDREYFHPWGCQRSTEFVKLICTPLHESRFH